MTSKHSFGETRPTVLMGLCMVISGVSISSMVAMGSRRVIMGSPCGSTRVISRVVVSVLRRCAVIAVIAVITRVMATLMASSELSELVFTASSDLRTWKGEKKLKQEKPTNPNADHVM